MGRGGWQRRPKSIMRMMCWHEPLSTCASSLPWSCRLHFPPPLSLSLRHPSLPFPYLSPPLLLRVLPSSRTCDHRANGGAQTPTEWVQTAPSISPMRSAKTYPQIFDPEHHTLSPPLSRTSAPTSPNPLLPLGANISNRSQADDCPCSRATPYMMAHNNRTRTRARNCVTPPAPSQAPLAPTPSGKEDGVMNASVSHGRELSVEHGAGGGLDFIPGLQLSDAEPRMSPPAIEMTATPRGR